VPPFNLETADEWLNEDAPHADVIISTRTRYARNLSQYPFSPRAKSPQLNAVANEIERALQQGNIRFFPILISELEELERQYLKESHLISAEMERAGEARVLYYLSTPGLSILVNEEDHMRIQCLRAGLRLREALQSLDQLESQLSRQLNFAFHERFGYLTACPTNVGTGLRVSVMMHLPALVLTNNVEEILQLLPQYGLTVRGFYGENSEFLGDFFQISNEVSLGKSEPQILEELERVVIQIMDREQHARQALFDEKRVKIEDAIWRAYGTLTNSRLISSRDALRQLSHLRLGIGQGIFDGLNDQQLNRLMIDVQPAHLQHKEKNPLEEEERDCARAALLRSRLANQN